MYGLRQHPQRLDRLGSFYRTINTAAPSQPLVSGPSVVQQASRGNQDHSIPQHATHKPLHFPSTPSPPALISPTHHPRLPQARAHIEGFLNYTFTDINWLEEALWAYRITMASTGKDLVEGNKRLAVVGDSGLTLVVVDHCIIGQGMTRDLADQCRKAWTSNESLCALSRAHEIAQFIEPNPGTAVSPLMRATAVEAILGAVFKDSGDDYKVLKRAVVGFGVLRERT
ncbi:hypothetical protein LTR36_008537 [Oleoguttula mirabilis]|uniref:RNase III domain-containing protein n=1 Tax=Oleoguttula mirabilis TaxID=1507867 RepID=A0AAV9JTA6_9PEZI|nr:hypothetical protein LTR36_008537 [Oleoguttula mirabilis]